MRPPPENDITPIDSRDAATRAKCHAPTMISVARQHGCASQGDHGTEVARMEARAFTARCDQRRERRSVNGTRASGDRFTARAGPQP